MKRTERALYMIVDMRDELELPVFVGSRAEVAEYCDMKPELLSSWLSRGAIFKAPRKPTQKHLIGMKLEKVPFSKKEWESFNNC